ncbi:MAG TPA: hypothetical protein VFR25_10725 [Candidatus Eisenbacteria bacterium]|nr:hypothetical protein [Candidatus Eisenbacteria bacterium]
MRVKVSRRLFGMCLLLTVLCLTPATLPTAYAKPIGWENLPDPNNPQGPKGDGDGTVVKAKSMLPTSSVSSAKSTASGSSVWSLLRTYVQLVRMGYGSRL